MNDGTLTTPRVPLHDSFDATKAPIPSMVNCQLELDITNTTMETAKHSTGAPRREPHRTAPPSAAVVPWTISRCNRLLRPLISKITILRKNMQRYGDLQLVSKPENTGPSDIPISIASMNPALASNAASKKPMKLLDDDWTPDGEKPQSRIRRTYAASGRHKILRKRETSSERVAKRVKGPILSGIRRAPIAPRINTDLRTIISLINEGLEVEPNTATSSEMASGKFPWTRGLNQLTENVRTSERELNQGVSSALRELLIATCGPEGGAEEVKPRSLLSTCLSKIADQIVTEQHGHTTDVDAEEDVQLIIYTELEKLGTGTAGWSSLRELAREHGIKVIGNAIGEGFIQGQFVEDLVNHCLKYSANREACFLYECFIATMLPLPQPTDFIDLIFKPFENHPVIKFSRDMTLKSEAPDVRNGKRLSCYYGYLAKMFEMQKLPVEWIMTKHMVPYFDDAIRTLTQDSGYIFEAFHFLKTVLLAAVGIDVASIDDEVHELRVCYHYSQELTKQSRSMGLVECPVGCCCLGCKHRSAVTETYINLVTVILSIGVVRGELAKSQGVDLHLKLMELLSEAAQEVLRIWEISLHDHRRTKPLLPSDRVSILLFAAGLERAFRCSDSRQEPLHSGWLDIIAAMIDKDGTDKLSKFLCTVSFCCSSAGSKHVFGYVKSLAGILIDISNDPGQTQTARQLAAAVAVDAALEYADMTQNKKHLDWALDLEETCGTGEAKWSPENRFNDINQTPVMRLQGGFRWEEGICEWIQKTPLISFEKKLRSAQRLQKVQRLRSQTIRYNKMLKRGQEIPKAFGIPVQATDIHGRPILVETKANKLEYQMYFQDIESGDFEPGYERSSRPSSEEASEPGDLSLSESLSKERSLALETDVGATSTADAWNDSDDSSDEGDYFPTPIQAKRYASYAARHSVPIRQQSAFTASPSPAGTEVSSADELSAPIPYHARMSCFNLDGASDDIDELAAPVPSQVSTARSCIAPKRKRSHSGVRNMIDSMGSSEDELMTDEPRVKRR